MPAEAELEKVAGWGAEKVLPQGLMFIRNLNCQQGYTAYKENWNFEEPHTLPA